MDKNTAISDDEYQLIFERALNNTLQIASCRFNARVVRADGQSTEVTEFRGDYVAKRGTYKNEKTRAYEVDWLLLRDGSYLRYKGQDWRDLGQDLKSLDLSRFPGLDELRANHATPGEDNFNLPALAAIPLFENLVTVSTNFTTIRTQTIGEKMYHLYQLVDSQLDTSTVYYVAAAAPERIMWIDETEHFEVSEDSVSMHFYLARSDGINEDQQPAEAPSRRGSWTEVTTAITTISDLNDPQILLPSLK